MKLFRLPVFLALGATTVALASANLLTFDSGLNSASVGTDYVGSDGVSFDTAQYLNAPFFGSPTAPNVIFSAFNTFTMDSTAGFDGVFSAYYASNAEPNGLGSSFIDLWSGANGTGTLLASLTTDPNSAGFNVWTQVSFNLGLNVAHSATFTGTANHILYDNVGFHGRTAAPEPFTMALGLAGVGLFVKRRRRSA